MSKAKLTKLVVLACGTALALGGCASTGWFPWVIGAGLASVFLRGQGA